MIVRLARDWRATGAQPSRLHAIGKVASEDACAPVMGSAVMMTRVEWFKRQFSFELPIEMFANVVERVRGTPARLEELTRSLSREVLTRRDGDKW